MLFLLTVVSFASMPRWITHTHDRAVETVLTLGVEVSAEHHHVDLDDADEPDTSFPDSSHFHVHYVAGTAATLPATLAELWQLAYPCNACPIGRDASTSDGALTTLHRPPIV